MSYDKLLKLIIEKRKEKEVLEEKLAFMLVVKDRVMEKDRAYFDQKLSEFQTKLEKLSKELDDLDWLYN